MPLGRLLGGGNSLPSLSAKVQTFVCLVVGSVLRLTMFDRKRLTWEFVDIFLDLSLESQIIRAQKRAMDAAIAFLQGRFRILDRVSYSTNHNGR